MSAHLRLGVAAWQCHREERREALANLHVTNACEVAFRQLRLREAQTRRAAGR